MLEDEQHAQDIDQAGQELLCPGGDEGAGGAPGPGGSGASGAGASGAGASGAGAGGQGSADSLDFVPQVTNSN